MPRPVNRKRGGKSSKSELSNCQGELVKLVKLKLLTYNALEHIALLQVCERHCLVDNRILVNNSESDNNNN